MSETSPGSVVDSGRAVLEEYTDLEQRLADPEVFGDQTLVRTLNKRYAALAPTVAAYRALETAEGDLAAARELAPEDESFAAEVPALEETASAAREHLRHLLVPRNFDDDRDVILEVKAGEGGEESALFAGDLLRMYLRYAEKRGWRAEVTDATESDLGGYKEARLTVKAKGAPPPGDAPWAMLKFEGGVHRVQRVPVTESQAVHSAAGVLVMPDVGETDEVEIHPNDLRIDVYRSSGPGGRRQHDRLRGPDHPSADRHRGVLSEREVAEAAEQGGRPAGAPRPAPPGGQGAGGGRGVRRPPQPGPDRRPQRADPHLQLRREPAERPPDRLQGVQPRPGARRRPGRRHRFLRRGRRRRPGWPRWRAREAL